MPKTVRIDNELINAALLRATASPPPRSAPASIDVTEQAYPTSWRRTVKVASRSGVSARGRAKAPAQATRIQASRQQPVSFVTAQAALREAEIQRMYDVQRRSASHVGAR